jgi:hypothetical protein
MSSALSRAFLTLLLMVPPAMAQSSPVAVPPLNIDARAALVEVLPSEATQGSPAAADLVNRLIRKHVLLLQHPSLLRQVLQNANFKRPAWLADKNKNPADALVAAIRVRVVPDTNIIEFSIDPAIGGDDAARVADEIVNQHIENQSQLAQNVQLERSVMLNNLKQRYQFRKDELARDLRERAVQLSVDGMGTPGRLSAKEIELQELLKLQFELERKKAEPESNKPVIDAQLKTLTERLDATKADLGALTNAMNQYLRLKEDETTTRDLLRQVNDQLDQISQGTTRAPAEIRWLCHPSK